MVCIDVIKSPRREREGAASCPDGRPVALAEGQSGRARSGGRGGGRDDGGAGVEGFDGLLIVLMPPPGAGGGSELSGRASRSASGGTVRTGAKRGKGRG